MPWSTRNPQQSSASFINQSPPYSIHLPAAFKPGIFEFCMGHRLDDPLEEARCCPEDGCQNNLSCSQRCPLGSASTTTESRTFGRPQAAAYSEHCRELCQRRMPSGT